MVTIITQGLPDEKLCDEWDGFVQNHNMGTIFQSSEYSKLFTNQRQFKPIAVLLKDDSAKVTGVLSGIIQYQLPGPLKHLSSRCIVMGGPLVKNNDPVLYQTILKAFDTAVQKQVVYTQVRNLFDIKPEKKIFAKSGYIFGDHLNILIDITQPVEILWNTVHKQKRYEIGRAGREGIVFKPITTLEDLWTSYELIKRIYKRIKLPVFPFVVFENAFTVLVPKGIANFWGAFLNGRLVGTMFTLCYNGRIYDYFAGSDSEFKYKFPNSIIPWQVMLWGKRVGMTLFDWGGAGKPGLPYGVRNYKEKFGGQLVNFGRFEKIHKPLLYRIAKAAFVIWQRVKA